MKTEFVAGIAPSGKCIIFKADADLSDLDESKLLRLTFEAADATTGHTVRAGGVVFEVLDALGIRPDEAAGFVPGEFNAASRIALGLVRCTRLVRSGTEIAPPTAAQMLDLPRAVLDKYLAELAESDRATDEDLRFFQKPAAAPVTESGGDVGTA